MDTGEVLCCPKAQAWVLEAAAVPELVASGKPGDTMLWRQRTAQEAQRWDASLFETVKRPSSALHIFRGS